MEQKNIHTSFPSWNELNQLFDGSLSESDALLVLERIRFNTPEDDAAIGLKNWLEKNDYQLSKLKQWVNRSQKHIKTSSSQRIPLPLKAAASIAILLASSYYIYQFVITEKAPWENYYTHDPGFPILMGESSQKSLWMELYRSGNTTDALSEIQKEQAKDPSNDTMLYYEAVVLFENKDAQTALLRLQEINLSQSNYTADIELLSAFCYWQLNEIAKAKQLFEQIAHQKNGKHSLKAQEILNSCFSKH